MKNNKTFVVAEIGTNHMGSVNKAKRMIEKAKWANCDAVKFQTYETDLLSDPSDPAYDILKKCELSYEQQTDLKVHADKVGIEFFSTPFDEEALFFLIERLGLRRIKLASIDVTNGKFLNIVNEYSQNLPTLKVILSTGMANYRDIEYALSCLKNTSYLTLMHCVSAYPTPEDCVNLEAIKTLKHVVHGAGRTIGYSDHTNDILAPTLAVIAGANTIEKHFTLDLNDGSCDNSVSADPEMMKQMVEVIRMHEAMMGDGLLNIQDIESTMSTYRRRS